MRSVGRSSGERESAARRQSERRAPRRGGRGSTGLGRWHALALALACGLGLPSAGCPSTPDGPAERATESTRLYKDGVRRFERGAPSGDAAEVDAAIDLLQKAKRLTPDHTKLREDLGRMLIHRAVITDTLALIATRDAEIARKQNDPQEGARKDVEAKALYEAARRDLLEAKSDLQYVETAVTPERLPNVYYFLTQIYTGLEDFAEARRHLDRAIDVAKGQGIPLTLEQQQQLTRLRQTLDQLEEQKKKIADPRG